MVVAHRKAMVAEGIAAALDGFPGMVAMGAVTSAVEAEGRGARADAVALDEALPGAEGAAARLRREGIRVVLLGEPSDGDDGIKVPTRASVSVLAKALAPQLGAAAGDGQRTRKRNGRLTPREQQVLALVSRGLVAKQVARQLGISPKTVELHKTRIFRKLGVPNQAAAVWRSVTVGLRGGTTWSRSST